jgi:hypothetical protein
MAEYLIAFKNKVIIKLLVALENCADSECQCRNRNNDVGGANMTINFDNEVKVVALLLVQSIAKSAEKNDF